MRVTRDQARNATWKATSNATRFATLFATFPQFSTLFVRASFARGKLIRCNEIRIDPVPLERTECGKMWKTGGVQTASSGRFGPACPVCANAVQPRAFSHDRHGEPHSM